MRMKRRTRWHDMVATLLGGLAVASLPGRAVAEPDGLRPVHFDKRHRVDVKQPPWRVMGRLQTELGTRCTGFLIAPNVVMTAAHCLWLEESGHFIRPHSVHFLRAYHRGHYAAEARAIHIIIAPGFDPTRAIATAQADRATIVLERPMVSSADIPPVLTPRAGDDAAIVGYEQDFPEIARGDQNCHVTAVSGRLIRHNCTITHGASGAPIMIRRDGKWGIGGITTLSDGRGGGAGVGLF